MTRTLFIAAFIWAQVSAQPVNASQAYSESLMDCAALFGISNRMDPEKANHGKGLVLSRISETLEDAAFEQAVLEGHSDPKSYLEGVRAESVAQWDSKGVLFVFSDEFKDWTSYCRKFSGHLGISFDHLR